MVQSSDPTFGPESLSKNLNTLIVTHTHTHTAGVRLTGHDEVDVLRYGRSQPVGGVAAVGSLVLGQVPIIGDHKGPGILLFHQPGVQRGLEFHPVLCPSESAQRKKSSGISFPVKPLQHQHKASLLLLSLLLVMAGCPTANELFCERVLPSRSHSSPGHSLWLGIPFGFARHGEVLVEGEGDAGAGRLSCDGGQLLNWTTNKQTEN